MDGKMIPHDEIERYVLGKMNQSEVLSFEKEIQQNPTLGAEVNFQQNVVRGIGEARKAALKNRLSQVPVSSSWISNALHSGWSKVAAGVVVASTASVLIYTQFESEVISSQITESIMNAPMQEEVAELLIPEKAFNEDAQGSVQDVLTSDADEVKNQVIEEEAISGEDEPDPANLSQDQPIVIAEVELPDLDIVDDIVEGEQDEEQYVDLQGTELNLAIDVITTSEERTYRYFDGALTLKGDYQSEEYDLIELNSKEGKEYFIEIAGQYYSMPESQQFRTLNLITSKSLISRLDSLTSID